MRGIGGKKSTKMNNDRLQTLRNRQRLNMWDTNTKTFYSFQLNKSADFICWEQWTSKDRRQWVKQNEYLSLKDVMSKSFKKQ